MRKSVSACLGVAVVLGASVHGAAVSASADVKITKSMNTGAGTMETTEFVKGQRTRTEMKVGGAMSMTTIQQCDLGRVVQVNDATKKYFVVSGATTPEAAAATASAPAASSKGGVVVTTTTIVDTGERKQVFGRTARHLKTKIVQEPGPNACDKSSSTVETDGWYIDIDGYGDGCMANSAAAFGGGMGSPCTDRYETKTVGGGKLGYPVELTVTTGGQSITFTSTAVENATLDAGIFEVPADYKQVKSFMELFQ